MYQHLNCNNILVNEGFGFRTKLSTLKATCNLISEILAAQNNKNMVGGIFCDLEKGFVCVKHDIIYLNFNFTE